MPAERWIHAALVHDPGEASLSLYLDGMLADRAKGAPLPDMTWRQLRLGTWYKANQAFRGEIDEVEVYDYPRMGHRRGNNSQNQFVFCCRILRS